ncbi:MAG TPA: glycosyltransferase [Kiloniellaceae bacterium]|nr:glycosyltransferase [Kiloniellaceae bacterium]
MIFLTVGTQVAFDRLVAAVDAWAGAHGRRDVVGQIGPSHFRPDHMEWHESLPPADFRARLEAADVLVAHAGLGSILMALQEAKPIVIFPRRAALGEQRNDHQLATARAFADYPGIAVAFDEAELRERLDSLDALRPPAKIGPHASPQLLAAVRDFIAEA